MKYQRLTTLDCKDIGIRQCDFVTKTRFLFIKKFKIIKETKKDTTFVSGRTKGLGVNEFNKGVEWFDNGVGFVFI